MLTFITTLRHPQNCSDYGRVEELLGQSLASMCRQSGEFTVIVVGNQRPSFDLGRHVRFVPVSFAPPSTIHGPMTGRQAVLRDKGTKLAVGLIAGQHSGMTHFMPVDADDLVSRRLAAFVAQNAEAPGWYVGSGYSYSPRRHLVGGVRRFDHLCGTSLILRTDFLPVPPGLPATASQAEVFEAFGSFAVLELLGSHQSMRGYCASLGRPLQPLPFPGAVYVVETGENHSGNGLRTLFPRPVSRRMHADFGLPRSSGVATWMRAGSVIAATTVQRAASRLAPLIRRSSPSGQERSRL
jgi:hypothetical protein